MSAQQSYLLKLASIVIVLIVLPVSKPYGQVTDQTSREQLIKQIKEHAERHVKNDNQMQTQLIVELYRNNSSGVPPQEIARLYEEEYSKSKEARKPSAWDNLLPNFTWILIIILFILVIVRDVVKDWFIKLLKLVGDKFYSRLAGSRVFRRIALKRYRNALRQKYSKLYLPFRPNRPLDMNNVYVPLKVSGATDDEQIDAYSAVASFRKIMIKGAPGAGKSTLLKYLALKYAESELIRLPDTPIPILLELHRLNDAQLSLEQYLIQVLSRNDFPNAERFISNNLKHGKLMLMLDGLDEVNSVLRHTVVQQIKDLADVYRNCRVLITCRSAVYKGELDESVDTTLEVVEFNDQQIRSFLQSWEPDLPEDKSIEQLMNALHQLPRIMTLARNPLLLTIISFLYTDDPAYILPNSRAEFYQQSTDLLLRQWHQERNKFDSRSKRQVLQHLALLNQDRASVVQHDRLIMDYQMVLKEIKEILPNLNLRHNQEPEALLEEIVERSGLLLSIDGGERYQFAHLTLQEFFAAVKLLDNPDGIAIRFEQDKDVWQETIKLWCSLSQDSTELIRKVYAIDQIAAFECLADAQNVDGELVENILAAFESSLISSDETDSIVRAFASVASDLRPRGARVFSFLEATLTHDDNPARRIAAMNALSLTNLPQAAKLLADQYDASPEIRRAIIRMGDVAVPVLSSLISKTNLNVLSDLEMIGTPQAAEAIVPWVFSRDTTISEASAWQLTALLRKPNVESVLKEYSLIQKVKGDIFHDPLSVPRIDWVWKPFAGERESSLSVIVGRIAHLLENSSMEAISLKGQTFDSRLIVPICSIIEARNINFLYGKDKTVKVSHAHPATMELKSCIESVIGDAEYSTDHLIARTKIGKIEAWEIRRTFERLIKSAESPTQDILRNSFIEAFINVSCATQRFRVLLSGLPPHLKLILLSRLYNGPIPTVRDWLSIFNSKYRFSKSWELRLLLIIALGIYLMASLAVASDLLYGQLHVEEVTKYILIATTLIACIWSWIISLGSEQDFIGFGKFTFILIMSPLFIPMVIYKLLNLSFDNSLDSKEHSKRVSALSWYFPILGSIPVIAYFSTHWMWNFMGLKYASLTWVLLITLSGLLHFRSGLIKRAFSNPFRDLFTQRETTFDS